MYFGHHLARLARCRRGGVALLAALCFPVLALGAFGAVDITSVASDRSRLQDVADSAALMGAKELGLAYTTGVADRAKGFALAQLGNLTPGSTVSADATINGSQITVVVTSKRSGLFSSLLPTGQYVITASATAKSGAGVPLCVTTLRTQRSWPQAQMQIQDTASLAAPGCAVHSNDNIVVTGSAALAGVAVGAVTTASGPITPSASLGVPLLQDPLGQRDFPIPSCPTGVPLLPQIIATDTTIPAGVHCSAFVVQAGARVTLAPGVHAFPQGTFYVMDGATLTGNNVVLVFGPTARFQFQNYATVDLVGAQSGPYAGMVMVASRDNTSDFTIVTSDLRRLEGVVYLPSARLVVYGTSKVGEASNWTVTVTDRLLVEDSAKLYINNNYAGSTVPVPGEVAPTGAPQLVN